MVASPAGMPERIGPFRLLRKLGEGGMGVVYAAQDERLDRTVALKLIGAAMRDEEGRKRMLREARAAASVNHPNVCQLFEIGEQDGELFMAMERLEGESLADRLARGTPPPAEAVQIVLGMLAPLQVLHARGLVHRDLKPSNVFLTPHGVKLLDFSLARRCALAGDEDELETRFRLTVPGTLVGTPRYMAPEQVQGRAVDARTDVFAVGAILFEALSGRPAFQGRTVVEMLYATLHEQPPALVGTPLVDGADRVLRRALAKAPDDRFPTAAAMADELRAALMAGDTPGPARARAMTRLLVLPFRVLRPDPETDFLAFSLPDAITSSLSGLGSLAVRSSALAARFASDVPDLRRIAAEADVDVVLTGTLLRAGDQLRVSTQLVEVPEGTVLWSHAPQAHLRDVFQVQDDLMQRILDSLSLPLTAREHRLLRHDVPASATAYELYLRGNQLSSRAADWAVARDLHLRCLEEDPRYAPAWARVGRLYRLLAKYTGEDADANLSRAESALRRALELNAELGVAHLYYAHLEAEAGRPLAALERLLAQARSRPNDPELFSGLVHVCRYCGLLRASLAAHEQASRLDPTVRTSVHYTYWMLGEYERARETDADQPGFIAAYALWSLGRTEEAAAQFATLESLRLAGPTRDNAAAHRAIILGQREEALLAIRRVMNSSFRDPEGLYFLARDLAQLGEREEAVDLLERVVEGGFFCFPILARDPGLDPLRADPEFNAILREADARHREAQAVFVAGDGERLLGVPARA